MKYVQKTISGGNICVHSSHDLCVLAHTHSLEGILAMAGLAPPPIRHWHQALQADFKLS